VLTGVVESRTDKRVAEALADSVPGTVDVENQLAIGRLGA
jgi:osmotically-inducible protein OsmY